MEYSIDSPALGAGAEMMDVNIQCSDDYAEEELFLPKARLERRASAQSTDSGIISCRQGTSKSERCLLSSSRPETVDLTKSEGFTRSNTVTSGFRSAAATVETPSSGWLPRVNTAPVREKDKSSKPPNRGQSAWTGLAKLIKDNTLNSAQSPLMRSISRADSFRDVDTSPCFVINTPEPPKTPLPVFKLATPEPQRTPLLVPVKLSTPEPGNDLSVSGTPAPSNPGSASGVKNLPPVKPSGQSVLRETSTHTKRRKRSAEEKAGETGMNKYGVTKNGVMRTVLIFSKPPLPDPLSVCFHYPNNFLTHRYVLDQVKLTVSTVPNGYVTALQFVDRNVLHGSVGLENRWVITLSCPEARDQLLRMGIKLFNRKINMRRIDEIINEEYREYQKYQRLLKRLHGEIPPEELDPKALAGSKGGGGVKKEEETDSSSDTD